MRKFPFQQWQFTVIFSCELQILYFLFVTYIPSFLKTWSHSLIHSKNRRFRKELSLLPPKRYAHLSSSFLTSIQVTMTSSLPLDPILFHILKNAVLSATPSLQNIQPLPITPFYSTPILCSEAAFIFKNSSFDPNSFTSYCLACILISTCLESCVFLLFQSNCPNL